MTGTRVTYTEGRPVTSAKAVTRQQGGSEADVLTAYGFRLIARAETAAHPYRRGILAAALVAFTDAAEYPAATTDSRLDRKGPRP